METRRRCPRGRGVALAAWLLGRLLLSEATAATLDGLVRDPSGKPVKDAVIYAVPLVARPVATRSAGRTVVDQQDKEFIPHVKPIQAGTEVMFPNKDNIRHHVYSFSPSKRFELPLYKGTPAAPVKFDRPGVVVLGCNIHDWMVGYVFVLDTPFFGTTAVDGRVQLRDLPPGSYDVRVWHPSARDERDLPVQRVAVTDGKPERAELTLALKPEWRPRRAPTAAGDRYR